MRGQVCLKQYKVAEETDGQRCDGPEHPQKDKAVIQLFSEKRNAMQDCQSVFMVNQSTMITKMTIGQSTAHCLTNLNKLECPLRHSAPVGFLTRKLAASCGLATNRCFLFYVLKSNL